MINLGRSKIGMAVVLVKDWLKGAETQIITDAFLDSGSSSTFCTKVLDDKVRDQLYKN